MNEEKDYKDAMIIASSLVLKLTRDKLKGIEIGNIDLMVLLDVIERLDFIIDVLERLSKE